jgi:hypothetical protein
LLDVVKLKSRAGNPSSESPMRASKRPFWTVRVVVAGDKVGHNRVPPEVLEVFQSEKRKL